MTNITKIADFIEKELSGAEFNELYDGINFYKKMPQPNMRYDIFHYKLGLNTDTEHFKPNTYKKNNFHPYKEDNFCFYEESKCHLYFGYTTIKDRIAVIKIPNDARVYIAKDKFKADKIVITDIITIDDISTNIAINLLQKGCISLQYVKEQTEEICKLAIIKSYHYYDNYNNEPKCYYNYDDYVQRHSKQLKYVKVQTEEICRLAVQGDGCALKYVKDQTEELCKIAVHNFGLALEFVKEQTEEICKTAVQQNGHALELFVQNQTEDICKLAVQQNALMLQYVINQTEDICSLAVHQDGLMLQYVKEQTEYICKLAVQQNCDALKYAKEQYRTDTICKLAVQQNGRMLKYVKNQTEEICKIAVQNTSSAEYYVLQMTDDIHKIFKKQKARETDAYVRTLTQTDTDSDSD